MRESLEEEQESKSDVQRQLAKAQNEIQQLRSNSQGAGSVRSEEMEDLKRKMNARLVELEEEVII